MSASSSRLPSTQRPRPYTTSATRRCSCCGRELNVKGHASHEKKCKSLAAAAIRDKALEESLRLEEESRLRKRVRLDNEENEQPREMSMQLDDENRLPDPPDDFTDNLHSDLNHDNMSDNGLNDDTQSLHGISNPQLGGRNLMSDIINPIEDEPELDDIKIEYHPASNRHSVTSHFHEFTRARATLDIPPEEEPFRPFRCRGDFEFARISMDAALKPAQVNALIKLIYDVAKGERFTLSGHGDLAKTWKSASDILTPFEEVEIHVPLLKEVRTYKVWLRPLWDWTIDLLSDSSLLPHFTWDAERLYKYDGTSFIRFYDEPWTGDRFWEIQSNLPKGAYPFCWVLYADKNKLSSFGTAKGYPVIVRCANLPAQIRNGTGIGGGRIVGWLPVVKEDPAHKGKVTYRNHKRAVWHEALREMLKSLELPSKEGYCFVGADGVKRVVHPCIAILSADYEEQTYMLLLRGLKGLCPCPICLVPADQQSNLSVNYPLRTGEDSMKSYLKVQNGTVADAEDELKPKGLRRVYNAFWRLENSDPHKAASWDRLHSYSLGIFGDHMWSDFRRILKKLGRSARTRVDRQFALVPRFRNLIHFEEVVHITFNDGSKYEDMARQLLFTAHNVITKEKSKHGYILLQCLRSFLILDTLLSFEVHTEDSIRLGEAELQNFSSLINAYVAAIPNSTETKLTIDWSFIKMHYQIHAFDDIRAKGASRNFSTKPNEKLHKPMRDAYHQRTNFRAVEMQILNVDHYLLVSNVIKSKLDELDAYNAAKLKEADGEDSDSEKENLNIESDVGSQHFYLGSPQKVVDVSDFEQSRSGDPAYTGFKKKLGQYLTDLFQVHSIALPNGRRIQISSNDKIAEYRLLKVNYENMVTWKQSTDYLRCHEKFFGHPRYDSVIVQTVQGQIFARLICLINCIVEGKNYPTALIQPCDVPIRRLYRKDVDLRFTRIREKPRLESEFVSIHTIIRGAVLVPAFDKKGDYMVMDVLDPDMFVRLRKMHNIW